MQLIKLIFFCCFICAGSHVLGQGGIIDTSNSYKQNIIYVTPFQFTENGLGFGSAYERALDKKGILAFYIPAFITFDVANTNRIYDFNTGNYRTGKADAMFYTMPGIKYYPAGDHRKINYAIGASFVIGIGQKSSDLLNLNGLNETEQVQAHYITGLMWQNAVNINLSEHLCINPQLGIGGTLINKIGSVNERNEFLIEGSFKIGYKF